MIYRDVSVKSCSSGSCRKDSRQYKDYVKYGTRLTNHMDDGYNGGDNSTADGTYTYTSYQMRYSNGVWCNTNRFGGPDSCTCQ